MNVTFLYRGPHPFDAVTHWCRAIGRHCKEHQVGVISHFGLQPEPDVVLLPTASDVYPRAAIDADIADLRRAGTPFGVVHNEHNPPVPSPGDYPSFAWTEAARRDLARLGYAPQLVRMPVFPAVVPYRTNPPLVATFGSVEPKKNTWQMYDWCRQAGIPFWAFCPDVLAVPYRDYILGLRADGCEVRLYPWAETVEELAPLFSNVSHFLFNNLGTKRGTGGCSTSARYAAMFNRPVIVIDDETAWCRDGYHVARLLAELDRRLFDEMTQTPLYDWSPDAYAGELALRTLDFWNKRA